MAQPLKPPLDEISLRLPVGYEADKFISRKWTRVATTASPDIVTLRMEYSPVKMPLTVTAPTETDLMKMDSSLSNIRLTAGLAAWQGRQVPVASYEGYMQGNIGVYGRMAWLPLAPGTVVVHLYSEPVWSATMNRDWNILLANLNGPIVEPTLRERAPGRWLAAKISASLGVLVFVVGVVMVIARMNDAVGGAVVWLGLLLPAIPLGWAAFHLHECWRALLVCGSGLGIFGISLLLER